MAAKNGHKKAGLPGLEPGKVIEENLYSTIDEEDSESESAHIRAQIPENDYGRLAEIVSAWSSLPSEIKNAIHGIVKSSAKQGDE